MVSFEEVPEEQEELKPSQERLLDAQAIEQAAAQVERPTARMQLESLAKKLRKESEALQRVERSHKMAQEAASTPSEEKKMESSEPPAKPASEPASAPPVSETQKFIPIDRFSFDAGGYDAPFVTLYVPLPGVGSIPRDFVSCDFTTSSFDLIVKDLNDKSYRLFKDNLEKDIDPEKSKIIIKADKVIIKLAKVKSSEYGSYDYWSKLTDKKRKIGKKDDPQASIMQMMKDMYDSGDDNMRKVIGETMMKQRTGELGNMGTDDYDMKDFDDGL